MRITFLLALLAGCGARSDLELVNACITTSDEECDGADNDCDGMIDEDIAPVRCGDGGCEVTVRCEAGVMRECVPGRPTPESCNLLDDDCDGQIDEGFGFGPVGEVIVLRRDEFDTGPCTSCSWAWGTTLAPANGGFLAFWNLGLSGGDERPTLYGRTVDRAGNPTAEIALLRQDFILELSPMLALDPLPARGLPLEADYRIDAGNVPGLLFATSAGQTEVVMPTPAVGPSIVPRTVWTGSRFVSAWEEESELHVVVLGADGSLERTVEVDPLERPAAITLGVFPGRVGILVSRYREDPERRDQWLTVLDALGNVVTPTRQIDVAYETWQRLVGTEDGWLHVRPNRFGELSTRQALDVTGEPLGEALPFADDRSLADAPLQDTFVAHGPHEVVAAWQSPLGGDMHVEFLDSRGDVLRGWSGPLPVDSGSADDFLVDPHITFVDERLLVIWHGIAGDSQPNRVLLRAFGCVP